MNETTLFKMKQMKLYVMHGAFLSAIETGKADSYTQDELVAMLTEAEYDDRITRRINRAIKNARFRYKASIENLVYESTRNMDKNKMIRFASCDFVKKSENILVTGSTGVGKSYIAGYSGSFYATDFGVVGATDFGPNCATG